MASYSIAEIRAIGPFYGAKLKASGIRSTSKLLDRAKTAKGRKLLSETAGIPGEHILKWANLADLMRVRGVASDYAELLMAAGVDTLRELKRRNAANLVKRMAEVNQTRKMVEALPTETRVSGWIESAKLLDPVITY